MRMASARPRRASIAVVTSRTPATITLVGIVSRHVSRTRWRCSGDRCGPRPVCAQTATPATGCEAIQAAYWRCAAASISAPRNGTGTAGTSLHSSRSERDLITSPGRPAMMLAEVSLLIDDRPEWNTHAQSGGNLPPGQPDHDAADFDFLAALEANDACDMIVQLPDLAFDSTEPHALF